MKAHFKRIGADFRFCGQSEECYQHQAACGYERESVTTDVSKVTCFYCLRSTEYINAAKAQLEKKQ